MTTLEKLKILSGAARYDASCASSGSTRRSNSRGIGGTSPNGICHSWSEDGRCISLLKILFTNFCIYDCAYCINRRSNDIKRTSFSVDEVVNLTINFYRRNYIEGLFLSSGVFGSPDNTLEKMVQVVKKLRLEKGFNGYIHLKIMPGASDLLFHEAGIYADRLSVNIELPSERSLNFIAPEKKKENILRPMDIITKKITEIKEERKKNKKTPVFSPAGQSTQLIIGATPEDDRQIMRLTHGLYKRYHLKRVYYSAYVSVNDDSRLIYCEEPDLLREHRLYQADWLLRVYGFHLDELVFSKDGRFSRDFDPKLQWALSNIHLFPMEINKIDYEELIRIPGIGLKTATKILQTRRYKKIGFDDLEKIGAVLKRAKYFITCNGKGYDSVKIEPEIIKNDIIKDDGLKKNRQLSLFDH